MRYEENSGRYQSGCEVVVVVWGSVRLLQACSWMLALDRASIQVFGLETAQVQLKYVKVHFYCALLRDSPC